MTNKVYKYHFDESVPFQEIEDAFERAMLAVEDLRGRAHAVRAWTESMFTLDEHPRSCTINTSTDVGRDLARIFTDFAFKEYGEHSVKIERIQPPITTMEGVRHD